ncbi:N-acetyltransferase [Chloroflexia bacterium SDU3-3]|nr:N-acetyltransferase [Chloroflexia bacterium SDU3-3]
MPTIHPTAEVSPTAIIGAGTRIWAGAQIRERAQLGANCIVGRNVYIENDVIIGSNVKIQNNASLYHGLTVEDGVFIGPHVIFTNDRVPRAIRPDGLLKSADDWVVGHTRVCYGAALGAGSIVIAGLAIGRWAMVGAGSVVTRNVPDYALVIGNPGRVVGYISAGGVRCATQAEAQTQSERESRS